MEHRGPRSAWPFRARAHPFLSLALALAPAACARPQTTSDLQPAPPGPAAPTFVRQIAPFRVLDEHGRVYDQAFLGGLDVPRPQFIDIDGDGDLDLFVQERSNQLMFFESTTGVTAPGYVWRTDRYQDLDAGEWTRFVDIDGDGDYDLLAEEPFSHIRLYRNEGNRQRAAFKLAADSLRDSEGKPIFADRQNILNIVDIDCDGLFDLFLGRVEGTITRYEEVAGSRAQYGVPRFRFVTDRWEGIEIIGALQMGSMHGANTMFFADADGDGDLDLYWGDFFEAGVLLIQNTGSCQSPQLRGEPTPIMVGDTRLATSGYNVPVLVDIDGDQDLDMFIGVLGGAFNPNKTSSNNFYFLQRQPGGYELKTQRYLHMIDLGSESIPAAGDIDGDGDLDLLVGSKLDPLRLQTSRLYLLRNTGGSRQPMLQLADTIDLATSYHYAPTLADLDDDGDLDLVLGTWNQGLQFYRNQGTRTQPRWVQDSAATLQLTRGSNSIPALADLDGDGDLDLMVGEASGELNYFRNVGTRQAFRFELVADVFQGLDAGRRSHPVFIDWDSDGDLDLLVGAEAGGVVLYRNDGTRQDPKFVADPTVNVPLPAMGAPLFVDLDGDGDLDLLSGALSGGLWYFERR